MNSAILKAFERGSLIIVLGAGCSLDCTNIFDQKMPNGPNLAKKIAKRFGVELDENEEPDLSDVVQAATALNSKNEIYDYVRSLYQCKIPSIQHNRLAQIPLGRIYTTNYDDSIELSFNRLSKQKTKVFRPNDPISIKSQLFDSVQIIKIHGDANDPNNDLILSSDDYAHGHAKISPWYQKLASDCINSTVAFVGSAAQEPILFDALKRVSAQTSASSAFVITPKIRTAAKLALMSRGFTHLPGKFEDLVDYLANAGATGKDPLSVARAASPALNALLESKSQNDREEAISALAGIVPTAPTGDTPELPPGIRPFFEGAKPDWRDIDHNVPAELEHDEKLLLALENAATTKPSKLVAVIGAAGTGKTTTLMKAARKIGPKTENPAFWVTNDIADPINSIKHLEKYYPNGYFLFFPSGRDFSTNINHAINKGFLDSGVLVAPYHRNAWAQKYKEHFEPGAIQEVKLGSITERDAKKILDKVRAFGPWTRLARLAEKDRVESLFKKSQRQLLVGLIETTNGIHFRDIIKRDFDALPEGPARTLVLTASLCTMHRHGAPLPLAMSALKQAHSTSNFNEALSQTLGLCILDGNNIRSRHPVYARVLVEQIATESEIHENLSTFLKQFSLIGTPVPKHADRPTGQLFKSLINYRFMNDVFNKNYELVESVYKSLETTFHSDGAFWLQYGLAKRSAGEHQQALNLFDRSIDAYGGQGSSFTLHALGLQHFIIGDQTEDEQVAREHMSKAVEILQKLDARDAFDDMYPISTLATGHVKALYKLGDVVAGRVKAKEYFERVDAVARTGFGGHKIDDLRKELLSFATTGVFNHRYWNYPFWNHN